MIALAVAKKGRPKMIGDLSSPPVSITIKSADTMNVQLECTHLVRFPSGSTVTGLQAANTQLCIIKDCHEFSHRLP
jgi:hypothetical protein